MREHTALPTTEEIFAKVKDAKVFSKLDMKNGYWQIPLSKESQTLTTFNTPVGRYMYKRMPFGISSANEIFQRKVSQAYEGLTGVITMFDDILVYGKDITQHNRHLDNMLSRTQELGIKLNRQKCKFLTTELVYMGHVITPDGIKPDPAKIHDIIHMPRPTDKKGVQRLMGMVTFLANIYPT